MDDLSSIRSARTSLPDAHGRRVRVVVDSDRDDLVVRKTGTTPRAITAIEREALVLSQLRHPDIVEMLTTEHGDGTVTLVTRFAGRASLANDTPPDLGSACRLLTAMFRVVDELHAIGWVHGRLTADHCIVDDTGHVTLCAFGAAHRASEGDARYADDVADAVAIAGMVLDRLPAGRHRDRRRLRSVRRILAEVAPDHPAALHEAGLALIAFSAPPGAVDAGDTTRVGTGTRPRGVSHNRRPWPATTGPAGIVTKVTPGRWAVAAGAVVTLAALFGCIAGIRQLGGPLANPFRSGVASADAPFAVELAVTVIRLAAIGACLYGVALAAATLAAVATQRPDVARLATRLAPPRLRQALVVLIGAGVLASVASPPAPGGSFDVAGAQPASPTTTAVPTTTTLPTTATTTPADIATADIATPDIVTPDIPVADLPAAVLPQLWVIEPGDHLWGVAEQTLAAHLGRAPTEVEVAPYWSAVIELNRESLVDRDNPDLVHVGQVIELPPL